MKTKNKLLTEHAVDYVEAINGSIEDLRKINRVRKYERVILLNELLGSRGVTLTSYGRGMNELFVLDMSFRDVKRQTVMLNIKMSKSSSKFYSKSMKWLR